MAITQSRSVSLAVYSLGAVLGSAIGGSLNPLGNQAQQPAAAHSSEPKVMVRCPECSELSDETARFCAKCGYRLIKD